ncbi:MAG: AMP-binding protein, partial [Pseudomonadota bacterium]
MTDDPLWRPSPTAGAALNGLARLCSDRSRRPISGFRALHAYSVDDLSGFWDAVWDDVGIIGEKGDAVLTDDDKMPGAHFFPGAQLNFAENCLIGDPHAEAIVFRCEDHHESRMTRAELSAAVAKMEGFLADVGVEAGDRVAAMLPNTPETIVVALATAALGAVFSSCSPDFGERGVLDRFGQIEPKVFVTCDGYWYNAKPIDNTAKVMAVATALLPKAVVVVPFLDEIHANDLTHQVPDAISYATIMTRAETVPTFRRMPFEAPLYILFSSGTTGVPKCIVHSVGGTLLQHRKEHCYHCDIQAGDRVFYFTTCGWMMWNWLLTALASDVTLVLYDGSPFSPSPTVLWDYA